ncbi:DUF1989 domain-containing protein [Phytoactinopolyspora halotolerans]|uniref:Urea carboxylase-associated family protein n=1 Tax=Phytoactinopolyspora halotolerans TaxID=1981512 RepID=A0A6L9SF56_9ACTN|nr:urea carboxylase-associated family protein [Phytoactinopolyspora halotolerans]NEE03729.1 urea carboxylase-associated family protein [Phytoactinopolyspora halotolerans]
MATRSSSPVLVPAREGRAFTVSAGQRIRISDVQGGQVGDVFAFAADNPAEHHSAAHTRAHVDRLFPAPGEQFVTTRRRPILTLIDDTSPGHHDLLIPACDPARYAALGADRHASCAENLHAALAPLGMRIDVVPQPINVFMHIRVNADQTLSWLPAETRSGDAVTFEAALDCIVVVSACPQDLVGINGGRPTPLAVHVSDPVA